MSNSRGQAFELEPQRKGNLPQSWEDCHYKLEVAHNNLETSLKRLETDINIIGTPRDSRDFRDNLNRFLHSTAESAKEVQILLGHLIGFENRSTGFQKTARRQQGQKTTQKVQESLERLKKIAIDCKERESKTPLGFQASGGLSNYNQSYSTKTKYNTSNGEDEERTGLIESNRRNQMMQMEAQRQYNEMLIRDREQGIIDIESQVIEINGIFKDIQTLVTQQGHMIDDIESNMSTAEVNVDQGVKELQKANESQSSANSKICWFAVIVTIAALILIIIILISTDNV